MADDSPHRDSKALWEMVHRQSDKVNAVEQSVIEMRADVRGLGGQFTAFAKDIDDLFSKITEVSKPKPSQLWQVVGTVLTVGGMLGIVMVYMISSSREIADVRAASADEVGNIRFEALKREMDLRFEFERAE